MWQGRKFADLSDEELEAAAQFYNNVFDEVKDHAPIEVWGFFSQKSSEIIQLQFARLMAVPA